MVILGFVILYGALHSWLASFEVKAWAEKRFGGSARRFYRLGFNALAVMALAPLPFLPSIPPDGVLYRIPFPWVGGTLLLQGLAGLGLLVGVLQTGALAFAGLRQMTQPPESLTAEGGRLVTGGLYRWMRHPLYTFGMAFIWLTPVMTRNALFLCLGLTGYVIVGAVLEERKLARQFGQAYQDYRKATPMFIPAVGKLFMR